MKREPYAYISKSLLEKMDNGYEVAVYTYLVNYYFDHNSKVNKKLLCELTKFNFRLVSECLESLLKKGLIVVDSEDRRVKYYAPYFAKKVKKKPQPLPSETQAQVQQVQAKPVIRQEERVQPDVGSNSERKQEQSEQIENVGVQGQGQKSITITDVYDYNKFRNFMLLNYAATDYEVIVRIKNGKHSEWTFVSRSIDLEKMYLEFLKSENREPIIHSNGLKDEQGNKLVLTRREDYEGFKAFLNKSDVSVSDYDIIIKLKRETPLNWTFISQTLDLGKLYTMYLASKVKER